MLLTGISGAARQMILRACEMLQTVRLRSVAGEKSCARLSSAQKKGRRSALFPGLLRLDQPFDARRARRLLLVSSIPLLLDADEPLLPVVALAPVPVLAALEPDEPPFMPGAVEGPALPGDGSEAPACPAAVPGPIRPALSESAGEPDAA